MKICNKFHIPIRGFFFFIALKSFDCHYFIKSAEIIDESREVVRRFHYLVVIYLIFMAQIGIVGQTNRITFTLNQPLIELHLTNL